MKFQSSSVRPAGVRGGIQVAIYCRSHVPGLVPSPSQAVAHFVSITYLFKINSRKKTFERLLGARHYPVPDRGHSNHHLKSRIKSLRLWSLRSSRGGRKQTREKMEMSRQVVRNALQKPGAAKRGRVGVGWASWRWRCLGRERVFGGLAIEAQGTAELMVLTWAFAQRLAGWTARGRGVGAERAQESCVARGQMEWGAGGSSSFYMGKLRHGSISAETGCSACVLHPCAVCVHVWPSPSTGGGAGLSPCYSGMRRAYEHTPRKEKGRLPR